ncbi:hypothetical protein [Actinomadura xylanilytica]|uniref:hypothetical protein n=1 Tax=Actinomadura xylanilytica TaxID=887459 RepID=UPI00255AF1FF|nr:hypothetical protein [Actinomadura xylanilytica]MDL4773195.1 hypothetical protein [Actinomadura xylanilytica]
MVDGSRWLADVDAHPGEARGLARRVLGRLTAAGIVMGDPTECVLGDVSGGYAPGPAHLSVVCGGPGGFPDVWPNGLEIDVGRTAFYGPIGEGDRVACPHCAAWLPFEAVAPVVGDWADEGGPGALACARCARRAGFNEWRWPVPCAFAELGLRFWNWPPLSEAFVRDLAGCLGHRLVAGRSGSL